MRHVSLCVLSYNRKEVLEKSLTSLRECTHYPYQLIVLDDASDQPTRDYVYSLVQRGMVSTALFNTDHNMGLGHAMNRGLAVATGDIIFKLDADLMYTQGWLAHCVHLLEKHEKLGCLGLFTYWHEPCHFPNELIETLPDHHRVIDFVGSAVGSRREIWDEFGPWVVSPTANFAEDVRFKKAVVAGGYYLALPLDDVVKNVGFGEQLTSLIKVIDWKGGKHVYNIPNMQPVLFGEID